MREWLKDARTERGLTCKQVATRMGISEVYYFLIEKGERQQNMDIWTAQKLAKALDVPIAYIVERELK